MFDTIRMTSYNVEVQQNIIDSLPHKASTYIDRNTGEVITYYEFISDLQLSYIKYIENKRTLVIQQSIPKFLFGENITLVNQNHINLFWDQLHTRLKFLLNVEIHKNDWIIQRCDVCWNFHVGDKVSEYIRHIGTKKISYMYSNLRGYNESIEFRNKSRSIIYYDKEKECIAHKEPMKLIQRAKGLLRMEIRPSKDELKKFAKDRRAKYILSKEFFRHITEKVNTHLTFDGTEHIDEIEYSWLKTQELKDVETVLGYMKLLETIGESLLKKAYGQNYKRRVKLYNEIKFPRIQRSLADLIIDYDRIS